jgi:hypothetical protein
MQRLHHVRISLMPCRAGDGVIFGLPFIRLAAGSESILPMVVMDSGLARSLVIGRRRSADPLARPGMTKETATAPARADRRR